MSQINKIFDENFIQERFQHIVICVICKSAEEVVCRFLLNWN